MKGTILRAINANKSIRAFAANTTMMVEEARKIHEASPVATAALGRTLTATSIMGLMLKGEKEKITVKINGQGPLGSIITVGNANGTVKGYISNPHYEGTTIRPGKLNVGEAVGTQGELVVIKDLGLKDPYVGSSPLTSGEIAEDFAAYFTYSEQQPSAVALGVLINTDYTAKAAGGLIIQILPNVEEEELKKIEEILLNMEPITTLMEKGMNEEDILNYVLPGMGLRILEKHEVMFQCDCSRERLERALLSLGKTELLEIAKEDDHAELVCHFCNQKYHFGREHILQAINEMEI